MITIREYARPATLEEAWQLNQKRPNRVLGGMLWLKMEKISVGTAIDLSALGLDTIEETDTEFAISAMATLRSLETHAALNAATNGAMREAVRHIVGVQFRNCATVGGSVYGRFGFSDVLTLLLPYDRDILTHVYIKKTPGLAVHYQSVRATQTDFPILTCAAARTADGAYRFAIGARPMKAMLVCPTAAPDELPAAVQAAVPTGSNVRCLSPCPKCPKALPPSAKCWPRQCPWAAICAAVPPTAPIWWGCLSSVPYRHWGTWRCSDANSFYVEP